MLLGIRSVFSGTGLKGFDSATICGAAAAGLVVPFIVPWRRVLRWIGKSGKGWFASAAKEAVELVSSGKIALSTVLGVVLCWGTEGVAGTLLCLIADPKLNLDIRFIGFFLSAYAMANFAGFLAFFIPAGIGVREAALIFLLRGRLSGMEAAFVSIALRVTSLIAEALFMLPLLVRRRNWQMRVRSQKAGT